MNNLIGISGKIGSGKDLAGSIIQYLGAFGEYDSLDSFLYRNPRGDINTTHKIKKYADKLKDIVCLMIGCSR